MHWPVTNEAVEGVDCNLLLEDVKNSKINSSFYTLSMDICIQIVVISRKYTVHERMKMRIRK